MLNEQEQERRLRAVYDRLGRYVGCGMVFPSRDATPEIALAGPKGTVSFISTGIRQFVLTCDHVWKEFQKERNRNPKAEFVVIGADGHESFSMSDARVIATGAKQLDMVTLDVPNLPHRLEWSGKSFYEPTEWPPPRPVKDDTIIAVGYPGAHQKPDADDSRPAVQLRPSVFVLTVSSVSDRHAVLAENSDANPRRAWKFDSTLDDLVSLGGVSGTPAFVYHPNAVSLAGVLYEASPTGHESIIFVAHASYICADGSLDTTRLPPF